jgi:hypothetical protein
MYILMKGLRSFLLLFYIVNVEGIHLFLRQNLPLIEM